MGWRWALARPSRQGKLPARPAQGRAWKATRGPGSGHRARDCAQGGETEPRSHEPALTARVSHSQCVTGSSLIFALSPQVTVGRGCPHCVSHLETHRHGGQLAPRPPGHHPAEHPLLLQPGSRVWAGDPRCWFPRWPDASPSPFGPPVPPAPACPGDAALSALDRPGLLGTGPPEPPA